MRFRSIVGSLGLLLAAQALPCSFVGNDPFVPDVKHFEPESDQSGYLVQLPQPVVKVLEIRRGRVAPGASCDDAGVLSIEITWPDTSRYKLKEVGFYFRVVSGEQPDLIFPREPSVGEIEGGKATFTFVWLDGHPSKQRPLDLKVEVFAVNAGLQLGPSAYFFVKADRGK